MLEFLTRIEPDQSVEKFNVERHLLEQEVLKVAKEYRELRLMQSGTRRTLAALMDALDDLAYFESQQQIKK